MNQTLSIVIPVFNEKDTLYKVFDSVLGADTGGLDKEIIIVDDFSQDGTREILQSFNSKGLKVLFNEKNKGKGFSVRRGLKEATGDFIIIQDADLEYNPKDYKNMIMPLISNQADVVYGSRFLTGSFVAKPYYLANIFLTMLSNLFTGLSLSDMETCYKCFNRVALDKIVDSLTSNRFDIEPEITAMISKYHLRITEVPIGYQRRTYADGKKISWRDGFAAIIAIIKFSFR
jgi:glycosyltransferase involved in cell wall biosynthesis